MEANLVAQLSGVDIYIKDEQKISVEAYTNSDITDDKVKFSCYDSIEQLKRGVVCDLIFTYNVVKTENPYNVENKLIEKLDNVVLVYINRSSSCDGMTETEYTFFK